MKINSISLEEDLRYQESILKSVSRTFALTIPLLPKNLEKVVGNTYLLCRIVDTIEDAAQITVDQKRILSDLFLEAVLGQQGHDIPAAKLKIDAFILACINALKSYPNQNELDLIQNTATVLRILQSCSQEEKVAIGRCISIMSNGMSRFHAKQNKDGLADLQEFEEYCYVVAGVVGEMLTSVFALKSPLFAKAIKNKEGLARAFGQALQMTNILKDSPDDRQRGVNWKPKDLSHSQLIAIAQKKLDESLTYIHLIPKNEFGIRRFCILAFGLAVLTIKRIKLADNFQSGHEVKLSRNTVKTFYIYSWLAARSLFFLDLFYKLNKSSFNHPMIKKMKH